MSRVLFGVLLVMGCSAQAGGEPSGVDAGDDAPPTSSGRSPLTSCLSRIEDAGARYTSGLCAPNPALAGCRMCLRFDDVDAGDNKLCVFACRIGMSDCPTGQTCTPYLGGSRDTQGTCRSFAKPATLGFCR